MDEEALRQVERCLAKVSVLEARRGVIAGHLERQGLLNQGTNASERLMARLLGAGTVEELEDLWEPFKVTQTCMSPTRKPTSFGRLWQVKRKTRASAAREKGLEELADLLAEVGRGSRQPPAEAARRYVDRSRGVATAEEALSGAGDIVAEEVGAHPHINRRV